MARRKRRRTKKSRSQHPATRPRLTLGDVVRVKDGVMDPDYDGYCIGGWSGVIIALDTSEQTPMALIEWDASTQRDRIDPQVRQRAASQGLSVSQMWLHLRDFERVARVKRTPGAEALSRAKGGNPPPFPGGPRLVVTAIPMCYGFATRCEPMGRLYGLPIVAIAAVPKSHSRQAFWLRSCALNLKLQALWRALLRRRWRQCVSVPNDVSIGVSVPGHGGSAGGGASWVIETTG